MLLVLLCSNQAWDLKPLACFLSCFVAAKPGDFKPLVCFLVRLGRSWVMGTLEYPGVPKIAQKLRRQVAFPSCFCNRANYATSPPLATVGPWAPMLWLGWNEKKGRKKVVFFSMGISNCVFLAINYVCLIGMWGQQFLVMLIS